MWDWLFKHLIIISLLQSTIWINIINICFFINRTAAAVMMTLGSPFVQILSLFGRVFMKKNMGEKCVNSCQMTQQRQQTAQYEIKRSLGHFLFHNEKPIIIIVVCCTTATNCDDNDRERIISICQRSDSRKEKVI